MPAKTIMGLPERIWANLTLQDRGYETPCLIWGGGTNDKGYGVVSIKGRQHLVHRVVYKAVRGEMPRKANGKRVVSDHLCRVHPCANPEHIDPVTDKVNILRGVSFAAVNAAKTQCDNGHDFSRTDPSTGQRICDECRKDRSREYDVARAAARKAARLAARPPQAPKPVKQPRQLAPCGTLAARLRHIRRGEPIDEACRAAHADSMRKWRNAP